MNSFASSINYSSILNFWDWGIFFLVLILTLLAVFYGHHLQKKMHKENSILDVLLMGRQLTLPLFIATLVATWYGGIFGVTQISFEKGIYNFVTQGFFWYLTYIIFALFMVKRIRSFKSVTLPEMVGKIFGPKSAKLSALFNFFNILPISYAISLGLFLNILFGGGLVINMIIGVSFAVIYTMFGGFRAVVFSDFVQFFVMCSSVFIVLVFSLGTFGGLPFLKAHLPSAHFSLTGGEPLLSVFVWGFIALSTLVDPSFYQRCFSAKTDEVAKKGILISTFIWFCFDICTTAGGMYARAVIPEASSKEAYMVYSLQLLPHGLRGFFLAGILATILSTLEAFMFIAGNTVSYDLLPKKWRSQVWVHYVALIVVGIISILLAIHFEGNIRLTWKTMGSYFAACLLIPIIYALLFPKKVSDWQFIFSSLFGVISVTWWRLGTERIIDELYIGMLVTFLVMVFFHPVKDILFRSKNCKF